MQKLELISLQKRYGDTLALKRADVTAKAGEVVAICGENGAGKSTLMSLLAGSRQPTAGEIKIDGKPVAIDSPHTAFDLGIRTVYQELSLLPDVSVAENLYLGELPTTRFGTIDWVRLHREASEHLEDLGLTGIDVRKMTGSYPVAIQQMIEIARAIQFEPKLLILDEPTGVLTQTESDLLFKQIDRLRDQGTIIFYISHRLEEVLELADRLIVLKDGETVDQFFRGDCSKDRLIHSMVGRSFEAIFPKRGTSEDQEMLAVRNLHAPGVNGVSFAANRGEILGIGGLVGAGRSEVLRAIFGAAPRLAGEVLVNGQAISGKTPAAAMDAGVGFVTEERKRDGLALDTDVLENTGLASMSRVMTGPFLNGPKQKQLVREQIRDLDIRPPKLGQVLRRMSGGNQQKVILGKWLLMDGLQVLLLDEPTRGVDIATKIQIYRLIAELAADGMTVILVSSEMPELIGLSHRILVMKDGKITGEIAGDEATEKEIFRLATEDANEDDKEKAA
ncbi:MAG: sugar ABC transporter ATP-binding protein [Pseudomonadota bacterium]|nr:sugar ABC transporter ATP-binding protein [Pseudomonadota bacterium]